MLGKLKDKAKKGANKVVAAVQSGSAEQKPYAFEDLRDSPFKWQQNCRITLYQDAHCGENDGPPSVFGHSPENCFEDIYRAILNAKRIVYITGWSVDTKISLVRRKPIFAEENVAKEGNGMMTIGELLKMKAEQGVTVLLHIWDEALSMDGNIKSNGMMATYDEETNSYFKGTNVICQLSYRTGFTRENVFLWTHHQKTVIVDAALPPNTLGSRINTPVRFESPHHFLIDYDEELKTYGVPDDSGKRYANVAFMTCEHKYEKIWDDVVTQGRSIISGLIFKPYPVSIFRPIPPEGWHIIGHLAERSRSTSPGPQTKILVVQEPPRNPDYPAVLARPVDFEKEWDNGAVLKSNFVTFWKPVPPPQYMALGHIAHPGAEKPPLDSVMCVHKDAVEEAFCVREEEDHQCLYWSSANGHFTLWSLRPATSGLVTGTFACHASYRRPHFTHNFYCLRKPPMGIRVAPKPTDGNVKEISVHPAPVPSAYIGRRRIIAFVGGLDLTYGRWDTPKHPLWSTLNVEHRTDFLHGWKLDSKFGPREPWHDIHCKCEGPIARDVLINFEQRWRKQAKQPYMLSTLGAEIISERMEEQLLEGPDVWSCRILRSIDQYSADIPKKEQGIQREYISLIRCAHDFIYMENQYFLGSAKFWDKNKTTPCFNLVPYEIASRIVKAILHENKPFMAYILIPLYPEGYPEETAIQEILKWQWNTISMMYKMVAEALVKAQKPRNPEDYLSFYCLGQREIEVAPGIQEPSVSTNPLENRLFKSRRVPIYCHSKLMICDDQKFICGSANINDRSLAGDRDSEICIAGMQPKEMETGQKQGFGALHKFRLSLWAEHCGAVLQEFKHPATFECIQKLNEIGEKNWELFSQPTPVNMESHLMRYPITVDMTGAIKEKVTYFPDTNALVAGVAAIAMPDLLTT